MHSIHYGSFILPFERRAAHETCVLFVGLHNEKIEGIEHSLSTVTDRSSKYVVDRSFGNAFEKYELFGLTDL
jgi:hypothetical protein